MTRPDFESAPTSVFVYGTLMPGERYAAVASAAGAPSSHERATLGGYRLYDLRPEGYPALVAGASGDRVRGWLLHYPAPRWPAALLHLDDLEGLHLRPPLYTRTLAQARPESGEPRPAWVYLYARSERLHQPGSHPVPSGDWTTVPGRGAGEGWPGEG